MNYKKHLSIILLSLGFCIEFSLGDFYCFSDVRNENDGGSRNFFRGQLSVENAWLSAEILYEGRNGGQATIAREILLFEFNNGENIGSPFSGKPLRIEHARHHQKSYNAYQLEWSNYNKDEFFFIHDASVDTDKKFEIFKAFASEKTKYQHAISKFKFERKNPLTADMNKWGVEIDADIIKDYTVYPDEEGEDALFLIFIDNYKMKNIMTNSYDFSTEVKKMYPPSSEDRSNPYRENPQEMDVYFNNGDYDAVLTFDGHGYDIYYSCDLYEGISSRNSAPILLFPNDENCKENDEYFPCRSQIQPSFNHDGRFVAFLNQTSMKYDFDLWIYDNKNRRDLCRRYKTEPSDYRKIDTGIVNVLKLGFPKNTGMDYAWHPSKNIIFYIKNINNRYQLISYDIDSNEKSVLLESTSDMAYVSISEDGKYVIFSYKDLDSVSTFNNCAEGDCPSKVSNYKIGVAELLAKNE